MSVSESEFEAIRDRMAANAIDIASALRGALTAGRSPAKRSKFGNVKKEIDGHLFDSSAEARRYIELKALDATGAIMHLKLQPRYTLQPAFRDSDGKHHREIAYVADFFYYTEEHDKYGIVEDVKGMKTPVYSLKLKLFKAKYPEIEFREVR